MTQPTPPPTADQTRPAWRNLPRNVWVVTATSFLTDVSSDMLFNLLPLFLADVLGIKINVIGVIEGIAETTASLLKIFSGWLSDRLGARKWPTVVGYSLSTLAKPFLYAVTSWWGVLAVRVADRIGKGIRTAPRDALVADSISPEHRGLAFGLHRAGDTAGAALGVLIALLIVLATQSGNAELTRATFQTVVIVSVIPAVLAVLVLAFGAREVPVTTQREPPRLTLRGFDRRFYIFLLAVAIFTLGNSADAFLILRAQERGLNIGRGAGHAANLQRDLCPDLRPRRGAVRPGGPPPLDPGRLADLRSALSGLRPGGRGLANVAAVRAVRHLLRRGGRYRQGSGGGPRPDGEAGDGLRGV